MAQHEGTPVSHFDEETRIEALDGGRRWQGQVNPAWNIGNNPNGGYLLALAAHALQQATPGQPDPLSITAHYLRPGLGGSALPGGRGRAAPRPHAEHRARHAAAGRPGTAGSCWPRWASLGGDEPPRLTLPMPDMPPPEQCVSRSGGAQDVGLPILDRLEIRLHPQQARPGEAGRALVSGWIRFIDGRDADPLACLLMADAFPPRRCSACWAPWAGCRRWN